jgi:two-component system response regulator YesN
MLVDADADNIKNFRTYIRASFPEAKIVGSFSDPSKDIIPVIKEWEPQLVIADIKFFGGVRFVRFKEIHEEFPELRFIVYGTYNESDYMKRAREFGVIDYIYRPVKPAELSRCLGQATTHFKRADDIRQQTRTLTQNYHERMFQYEEIFLRGLLEGHITRENEIRGGFSYFNIPFDKGFSVLLFRIDHYRQVALALPELDKHLLVFKILRIVQEELREHNAQAFIRFFNEVAVILSGYHSIENKVLLCDRIKQTIHEQAESRVTAGIGRTYDNPADIAVSFREADSAFRYRYRMGFNSVIPLEFVEPDNHITYRYPMEREERLVSAAVVGDYEYCRLVLNELFQSLAQAGKLPEHLISRIVMIIVFRISRYISEQNLSIANNVTRFFPTAEILGLNNLEDGLLFLENALRQFCVFVAKSNEQGADALHESAREYVRAHYHENFSISKTAISLGTTPENLNRVFMEKERMMLFDFVMYVRVYEAQQLLTETEMAEDDIAMKVGFDDVKYFRSIFKKYNGDNPAEYRSQEKE